MFNPFGLTGWEAVLTTGLVCATVAGCVVVSAVATIKVAMRICEAVEAVAKNVAGAVSVVMAGKRS